MLIITIIVCYINNTKITLPGCPSLIWFNSHKIIYDLKNNSVFVCSFFSGQMKKLARRQQQQQEQQNTQRLGQGTHTHGFTNGAEPTYAVL